MGLQFSLQHQSGALSPTAYAKVSYFAFDDSAKGGRIVLSVYNSKADKEAGKPKIIGQDIEILINDDATENAMKFSKVFPSIEKHGPRKVSYVIAKQMQSLSGAVDVLEDGQLPATLESVELV